MVDDSTIELVTKEPTVNMLYWLAEAFIAPPKYITENPPDVVGQSRSDRVPTSSSSGARATASC